MIATIAILGAAGIVAALIVLARGHDALDRLLAEHDAEQDRQEREGAA